LSSHALRLPWTASRPAPLQTAREDTGDEALARRAAAGDGAAFATLYDRYERRAYNLCYRITGSPEDAADATQETFVAVLERLPSLDGRELNFGSYLMTAARNASYDAIARRKRAAPAGDIPDSAVPVGAGGEDPDRPERHALRAAHQEQIRAANQSLPARQREVLALRELEELSYDDVAHVMGMNRNSVAQLISRARLNLRDNLRQTALGSVAASSPLCERALPLLAMRQDDALDGETSAGWLAEHLTGCGTCRVRLEAMEEAGVAYRLWLPLVPALLLRGEAIAHAAERVGADWSAVATRRSRGRHLRLAAVGGAVLVIAFALALVDRAQTPTRLFPAPASPEAAAPVEAASAPVETAAKPVEPRIRRAPKRRAKPRPAEPPRAVPVSVTSPARSAIPAAPAADAERVRRHPPERRRQVPPPADAPAADPVVADAPPDPVAAPCTADCPGEEAATPDPPEPVCTGPNCPGNGSVTVPPCPTATMAAGCPRQPPVPCTSCQIVAVRPQPTPANVVTTRPPPP
jgi:RNA polymerase sigma factor (sigma-70 family)